MKWDIHSLLGSEFEHCYGIIDDISALFSCIFVVNVFTENSLSS